MISLPVAVLAEDHPLSAQGLAKVLAQLIDVAATVGEANQVLDAVRLHCPSILLLDLVLDGGNGLDLIVPLLAETPRLRIVAMSGYSPPLLAEEALARGAIAFVSKAAAADEFRAAVTAALVGERYISQVVRVPSMAQLLPAAVSRLTARQIEILRLIADGFTSRAVARRLGITTRTVHYHRTEIRKRLQLASDWELRRLAHSVKVLGTLATGKALDTEPASTPGE